MIKYLYSFITILFLQSCSLTRSRLGEALQQSGKNREELERVLQYFSQKETDSLHLKSAQFLITHMPGHYSWPSEELEQYSQTMDSIHPNMPSTVWHNDNIVTGDKKKIEESRLKEIARLAWYIDSNGNLINGIAEELLNEQCNAIIESWRKDKEYKDYILNKERIGIDNFINLKVLTKGC